MYKIKDNLSIIRQDGLVIPVDSENVDYQHYLKWVQAGNAAEPSQDLVRAQYPRFYGNQKLDLFTQPEQLTVVTATMTDPVVKLIYDRFLGAAYLTYEDPEVEAGFSLLVSKGLITAERKAEIVAQMQPSETHPQSD